MYGFKSQCAFSNRMLFIYFAVRKITSPLDGNTLFCKYLNVLKLLQHGVQCERGKSILKSSFMSNETFVIKSICEQQILHLYRWYLTYLKSLRYAYSLRLKVVVFDVVNVSNGSLCRKKVCSIQSERFGYFNTYYPLYLTIYVILSIKTG